MLTGHDKTVDGFEAVYEFRHLTFQEYLAARGYVEEQFRGREVGVALVDLLKPHFDDSRWREVIPLAAVLAGSKAEATIKELTAACASLPADTRERRVRFSPDSSVVVALRQCLLDEV